MSASSYDAALARLLAHEGGYTNHPSDPGGPTNFGITIADYRRYVKPEATAADVRAMPIADAKAIYKAHYWDAMRCDGLPPGLDYAVFDYGVNSGIGRSQKVLQRVLGVPADGKIGDGTIKAAAAADPKKTIADICDERLRFLQSLRTWPVFGKGWGRRVMEVKIVALAMAASAPMPDIAAQSARWRAAVRVRKGAQQGTAGAAIAAGAAAAQQAHQNGSSTGVVIAIAVIAVAAAIAAYAFWHWWQKQQQEKIA
jgi:lysozyme family protein